MHKQVLALNNLQELIAMKPNQTKPNQTKFVSLTLNKINNRIYEHMIH